MMIKLTIKHQFVFLTCVLWLLGCIFLSDIFTAEKINKEILLHAQRKKYFNKNKQWELIGDAEIKNKDDRIRANTIKYFQNEEKAIALGQIELFDFKESVELFGETAEYYLDTKYAVLKDNAYLVSHKENMELYSDIIERDAQQGRYIARNNVKIILQEDETTIFADKASYIIDEKRIILEGNPRIVRKEGVYKSEKAYVDTKTQKIVLTGQVNIFIKEENIKIRADKMIYYSKSDDKKTILTGQPEIVTLSDENSLLKGKPYRKFIADKIIHFNSDGGKGKLIGNAKIIEYYVQKEVVDEVVNFKIYERCGKADTVEYLMNAKFPDLGLENKQGEKYTLKGNAFVYSSEQVAFAKRIDFFSSGNQRITLLEGNVAFYQMQKGSKEPKLKAYAERISYLQPEEEVILETKAKIISADYNLKGDKINYLLNEKKGWVIGNASLARSGETASAQRIDFIESEKLLILKGNAFIKRKDELEAWGNYIEYSDIDKKGIFKGEVKLVNPDGSEAYADKLTYQKKGDIETILLFGSISSGNPYLKYAKNEIIQSKWIEYRRTPVKDVAYLDGDLQYRNGDRVIRSNSMVYYRPKKNKKNKFKSKTQDIENQYTARILFKEKVYIDDSQQTINGDQGEFWIYEDEKNTKKKKTRREKSILKGYCHVFRKATKQHAYSDSISYYRDEDGESVVLEDNVEVLTQDQAGYAQKVFLYPNFEDKGLDKTVLIGSPIVENEEGFLYGEKIELYQGKENYLVVKENGVYKNKDENQKIQILADKFIFNQETNLLRAEGKVQYENKDQDLKVYSDFMDSYRKQKRSILSGNIKVEQEKRTIYGEHAEFNEDLSSLVVLGNASTLQNEDLSLAEKIVLDVDKKTIQLFGVKEGQYQTHSDNEKENTEKNNEEK